jgi:Family of unknown function (DUF5908)
MPLEVNEIGISMRVRDSASIPNAETGRRQTLPKNKQEGCADISREEVVDDCVRRVLQILKSQGGR